MIEWFIIATIAFLASGLTFFSGFGLGTILTPVFALFFPVSIAVAATAMVHLVNNLFKFGLMAKQCNWRVVLRFGVPAMLAAFVGAELLTCFKGQPPLLTYTLFDRAFQVLPINAVIGSLICLFALLELWPRFQRLAIGPRYIFVGGALSGFFGGLSGHQGALRSAFLIKLGLSKEAFIATGIVAAVLVDLARLLVYSSGFLLTDFSSQDNLLVSVVVAIGGATLGALVGKYFLHKVTLNAIRYLIAVMMLGIGVMLAVGIIGS